MLSTTSFRLALSALAVGLVLAAVPLAPARAEPMTTASVEKLMDAAGYSYTRHTASVWTLAFTGKALGKFDVILATQDDLVVAFVIVAKKGSYSTGQDALMKIARFNHGLDRVKVGIDDDGDLFVRTDLTWRVLDAAEIKAQLEQLAAAADEVDSGMAPFRTR